MIRSLRHIENTIARPWTCYPDLMNTNIWLVEKTTGFFLNLIQPSCISLSLFPFSSKHSILPHPCPHPFVSQTHLSLLRYGKILEESILPISTSSSSYFFFSLWKPSFYSLDSYSIPNSHKSKVIFQASYYLNSLATSDWRLRSWVSPRLKVLRIANDHFYFFYLLFF